MTIDVLVLGAGISGLEAARLLLKKGHSVKILEARDRIGGRIYGRKNNLGTTVQLGAEFIHGTPKPLLNLIKEAGLELDEVEGENFFFQDGKITVRDMVWPTILKEVRKFQKQNNDQDHSFKDFLDHYRKQGGSEDLASTAESFIQGFHAAESSKISLKALIEMEDQGESIDRNFRIRGEGYSALLQWYMQPENKIAENLILQSPVIEILWKKNAVQIRTAAAEYQAKKVLITFPVGVLKSFSHKIRPALSEKQAALQKLEMGNVVKVVLQFKNSFWNDQKILPRGDHPKAPIGFLQSKDSGIAVWWTQCPSELPILTGWAGGPKADRVSGEDLRKTALESISRITRVSVSQLEDWLLTFDAYDWAEDEFSRGAYSYVGVDGIDARKVLAAPVEDTLYFAGEALFLEGENGTVHGAIGTAHSSVKTMLKYF